MFLFPFLSSFDYDDGAGRMSPNVTGMFQKTYNTPGEYHLQVYGNDLNHTFAVCFNNVMDRVDVYHKTILYYY